MNYAFGLLGFLCGTVFGLLLAVIAIKIRDLRE